MCEVNAILEIALSTISAHLKSMKYSGIIEGEKEGRWVIYKLVDNKDILDFINYLYNKVKNDPVVLQDKKKLSKLDKDHLMCH